MFVLYSLLVLVIFLFVLVYYVKRKNDYWKKRGVPSADADFLFGNIKNAALRKENMAEALQKVYNDFPNEPVVGMYRMTSPCLLIRDLDIIKYIMIKDFDKFEDRGVEFSKEGLGANLFHADGETWRVLRGKFSPMFTTGKLKNMVYLVNERADAIIKHIDDTTGHTTNQEVTSHLKRYTSSTIIACAFGLEIDTVSDSLMDVLLKIDNLTLSCNFLHEVDMMFPGLFKKMNASLFPADVNNFFSKMVSDVINKRNGVPSGRNDFMDLILEMRNQGDLTVRNKSKEEDASELTLKLTEGVIAAQAFVFYIGGYETSSTILSYLLYELAKNPTIQDKLIEEVDKVVQKFNGEISYEAICEIPYMDQVFNEALRKYPIVPLLRKSNTDYKIPGTEYLIEKDTVVLVSPLGLHYDEKYYPDPHKFDPERFSPENSTNRHPCAFLPFGVGQRNCIGLRFARLQTRIFALKFFSKFRVEPSKETKPIQFDPHRLLINPEGGIHLNVIQRKKIN